MRILQQWAQLSSISLAPSFLLILCKLPKTHWNPSPRELSPKTPTPLLFLFTNGKEFTWQCRKCEMRFQSMGQENPLEEEVATHSSILAWKMPWVEEPGRLQSMGLWRVGHYWETKHTHIWEKNSPGKSQLEFCVNSINWIRFFFKEIFLEVPLSYVRIWSRVFISSSC